MTDIYPKAPIDEAILEIMYPPNLSIEPKRYVYYEEIKDTYPQILLPKITNNPISLEPYQFRSDDPNETIQFSIQRMSFHKNDYRSYSEYREKAINNVNLFTEIFSINTILRYGLRYLNIIPFERIDNNVPLNKYFNFNFLFPKSVKVNLETFDTKLLINLSDAKLYINIHSNLRKKILNSNYEAFKLDLDVIHEGKFDTSTLPEYIDKSHIYIKKFFEEFITDDYRKSISE